MPIYELDEGDTQDSFDDPVEEAELKRLTTGAQTRGGSVSFHDPAQPLFVNEAALGATAKRVLLELRALDVVLLRAGYDLTGDEGYVGVDLAETLDTYFDSPTLIEKLKLGPLGEDQEKKPYSVELALETLIYELAKQLADSDKDGAGELMGQGVFLADIRAKPTTNIPPVEGA